MNAEPNMGTFYVDCTIESITDRTRSQTVAKVLVDTGSDNTWLPAKALVGIVAVTVLTLTLIWLLLSALNRKETTPSPPPTDYSAPTGTP